MFGKVKKSRQTLINFWLIVAQRKNFAVGLNDIQIFVASALYIIQLKFSLFAFQLELGLA